METNIPLQESQLELIVSEKELGHLTTNARQIRDLVKSALPRYDIGNYNDENIDQAKKDKAALNKAAKALNAKRLEIEREFMKPFGEFKEIVGETVKLIGECSAKIDAVVKQNEQLYKDRKLGDIQDYFNSRNKEQIDFGKVFNPSWLNKTCPMKSVRQDIDFILGQVEESMRSIQSMYPEDSDALCAYYKESLDLNAAIRYAARLNEQREQARKAEEERQKTQVHKPEPIVPIPYTPPVVEATVEGNGGNNEMLYTRTFRIRATKEQIISLGNYMNENNIEFERIDL